MVTVAVEKVNLEVQGLRMLARGLGDDLAPGSARTRHLLVQQQL